jgi:23S rRNA (adenine2503-C2)-methyltransferase
VRLVVETADGHRIEAVRIPLEFKGRHTVCVSSQAGCALACTFCATGRLGLARNLEAWEIVDQVRVVRDSLDPSRGERLHGVVFQGMGEPLANLDRVLAAVAVLAEPCAVALDPRRMTICTVGIPAGIRRLAREAPRIRLAISIGSPDSETRRRLIPIEAVHPLDEVLDAAVEHARATRLRPLWAYTLLEEVNDDLEDARSLARLAHAFAERSGFRPRVTLIPYNPIDEAESDPFTRSSPEREWAFRETLWDEGVYAHRRYSGGADVAAACGQLAGRV